MTLRDVVTTETLGLAEQVAAPVSTTFTLGARASSIRLALRNDSDSDLRVRVRLTSSKLRFPEGESVFTLTALATTSIEIPVEARSNGRFPVTIQLLTPDGDLPVSRPTVFTARVNALAGLGQLVTGIALLLLAAWWLQHLRRQQERKEGLVTNSARRHPSGDSSEGAGPAN